MRDDINCHNGILMVTTVWLLLGILRAGFFALDEQLVALLNQLLGIKSLH